MGNEKSLPDRCNSTQTSYLSHNYDHHHHQQLHKSRNHPVVTFRHSISNFSTSTASTDDHPASTYNSYNSSRPPSRAPSTTKSYASSSAYSTTGSACTLSTTVSNRTVQPSTNTIASKKSHSESKQTKYLKEQLYIKSYLDIVEQDRLAQSNFKTAKPGIRNYTPKILVQAPPKKELDVWI